MKHTIYILILLIVSCNNIETIDLPKSDFTNYTGVNYRGEIIFVEQLPESLFKFIFQDTIIAHLDSTLHSKVYDLKIENSKYSENIYSVNLLLDKDLSYQRFQQLTTEFRKCLFQKFIIHLKSGKKIVRRMPSYIQSDDEYIDARLKGHGVPNYEQELIKPYMERNNYVKTSITKGRILVTDSNGMEIKNYPEYLRKNSPLLNIYKLDSTCTLQDYVDFLSFSMKPIIDLRNSLDSQNYNREDKIKKYPMALLEENVP